MPRKKYLRYLVNCISTVLLWTLNAEAISAEFIVKRSISINKAWENYTITIRGEIVPSDIVRLKSSLNSVELGLSDSAYTIESTIIHLDSPGGDAEAAMQMGGLIRRLNLKTNVTRSCASSCVFLLAAGVERGSITELNKEIFGIRPRIGIHRPHLYMARGSESQENLRERMRSIKTNMEQYLDNMGISSQLIEMIFSLPPETIRWLEEDEARLLGILGTDSAWDEYKTAQEAASVGLSSSDYRSKSMEAIEYCKRKHDVLWASVLCRKAYIRGMTEEAVDANTKAFHNFIIHEAARGRVIKMQSNEMKNCGRIFSAGGRSC